MTDAPAAVSFSALGTTATIVLLNPAALPAALEQLHDSLDAVDRACSRFRLDSELVRANACAGSVVPISPLLSRFLRFALDAATTTDGRLDPTLGAQLREAGYDRTFALVRERESWRIAPSAGRRGPTWKNVELDDSRRLLCVPPGAELDLGATAKALAADEAAGAIAESCDTGVLVSLGGDLAVAGAGPEGGWPVLIADDHAASVGSAGPTVAIATGGVATSSIAVRRWRTNVGEAHHILDPHTCRPAITPWRTVSVAAASCAVANVAATTAIILGEAALGWLTERQLPARCVRHDGSIVAVGGWPAEARAA
jgi:thiamine biosynthesis lipoprotein